MATTPQTLASTPALKTFPPVTVAAPGPGHWELERAHWARSITPWAAEAFPSSLRRGFTEGCARYGLLISHLDMRVVNGFVYNRIVPAVGPDAGPEAEQILAERFDAAERAIEGRIWRSELDLWDREVKPDSIRRNRALQDTDLAALDDGALARHLDACRENHALMAYRHHQFTITALIPVGMLLAKTSMWTGAPRSEVLGLLRGSTPLSRGIAADELRAVGAALRAEGLGPASFAGVDAAVALERLLAWPGAVGESVARYLDVCGLHVASGYDVADLTTREIPDAVLLTFWSARDEAGHGDADDAQEARVRMIRETVPPEHRAEFDDLLAEARMINRLRDERGVYNDLWAAGIARRAILEAGRRLAVRGRLDDDALIFEATPDEMIALLRGAAAPSSSELAARARRRAETPMSAMPATLGDEPAPPPSLDGLPPHAQLAMMATAMGIEEVLGGAAPSEEPATVAGKGVSAGCYEGTARVISGPADFNRLGRGDVLVTGSTNASFNVVLPLLGAIVTDRGALLSHAAIVAREYGIPAVVATGDATRVIKDGARVRVDGARGTVEVL